MKPEEINYRWLCKDDLVRLAEIDRSEHITRVYSQNGDILSWRAVDWQVPNWTAEGDGEHSLNHVLSFCQSHLEMGAVMRGALAQDKLAGIGILHQAVRPFMDQLAFLHVSRDYRRQGIAGKIFDDLINKAVEDGARRLYVSATPSGSAVGFYLDQGFKPVDVPLPELLALEPEDIHLIKELK